MSGRMDGARVDGARVVEAARGFLGTPYVHGGALKGVGVDCLGLLRGVWRELYGAEPERPPPYGPAWRVPSEDDVLARAAARHLLPAGPQIAPGDVLLFRLRPHLAARHAAIATGARRMIHAHEGAVVCEVPIGHWGARLAAVFAWPG